MHENFAPLLAKEVDFKHIDYKNTWLSAKLDGIRAIVIDGVVMSRSLKPIPNAHVQSIFGNRPELEGFDGELIVGEPNSKSVYQDTYSGVMSKDGCPEATLYAFDHISHPNDFYARRYERLSRNLPGVVVVDQHPIDDHDDLLYLEEMYLNKGYEGVMLRAVEGSNSTYKFGRSTSKGGTLLKLKRFSDDHAQVVGFIEEEFNGNIATTDALGHIKRSSHAENKVGKGRLGALKCVTNLGVEFNIGTGFTAAQREEIWNKKERYINQLAKYKSFAIGIVKAPRFPVFLGWRSGLDT